MKCEQYENIAKFENVEILNHEQYQTLLNFRSVQDRITNAGILESLSPPQKKTRYLTFYHTTLLQEM